MSVRRSLIWFLCMCSLGCGLLSPLLAAPSAADRAFTSARQLLETGNPQQALDVLAKFRADYPRDTRLPEALYLTGRAYQGLKKLPEAINAYAQVVKNTEAETALLRAAVYFQLAECYWQQGAYDKAAQACRDCLPLCGEDADLKVRASYWLGRSLAQLGKADAAMDAYAQVAKIDEKHPLLPWSLYAIGSTAYEQQDYARVITTLEKLRAEYKTSPLLTEATMLLGASYAARVGEGGNTAAQDAAKAQPLLQGVLDNNTAPRDVRVRAAMVLAQLAFTRKEYDRAQAAYGKALLVMDGAHAWRAEALLQRGHALYNLERYREAASDYSKVTEIKDAGAMITQAWYWLGNSWYQIAFAQGDATARAEGVAALRKFIAAAGVKHAQAPRATLLLALLLEAQATNGVANARGEAIAAFKELSTRWPTAPEAAQAVGGIARLTASMSRTELEQVAGTLPTGAAAWQVSLRLAQEQLLAGKHEDAITAARKVLAEKPEPELAARAWYLIAAAQYRQKRYDDAAATYRQVLALSKQLELLRYAQRGLTQALLDGRKYADARKAAEALVALPSAGESQAQKEQDLAERLQMQAEAAIGDKQYADAAAAYARIQRECASSPLVPSAMMGQAWIAETTHDKAGAIGAYLSLLEQFPRHTLAGDAGLRLGMLLRDGKAYPQALEALQKIPTAHAVADQAAYLAAWVLLEMGKADESRAQFARVAAQFPTSPWAAESLYQLGAQEVDAERYTEAIPYLTKALTLTGPSHELSPMLTYKLAVCALNTGAVDKAAEQFGTVVAKYPASSQAEESLFWQAQALEQLGGTRLAKARELYLQYTTKYKDGELVLDAQLGAGRVALLTKQYAPARTALRACVQACEKVDAGKVELAERAKNVAPEAQYLLAQSYFEEKQYPRAITEYAAVGIYALEPWYSRSLLQTVRCNALNGQKTAAERTLALLLASFPNSDAAKQANAVAKEYGLAVPAEK